MIHARGLARTFDTKRGREKVAVKAVAGVDIDVEEGEIVGFLGPNGAGKTTTLRMLTTLLKPTEGTATVAGYDLAADPVKVRSSIGYVSQSGSTSGEARAGEEIMDHGMLYGISRQQAERRGRELFEQLDLDGMWTRAPRTLSGGQRRRLDIAMGLVHDPKLVFLDEPTTGLDPQARANLWTHISDLRTQRGATVFLTTHYLDEADALCDRILVIDHGSIVASDTPEALKSQVAGDLIELVLTDAAHVTTAAAQLTALAGGTAADVAELTVSVRVPRAGTVLPGLLRSLDSAGVALEQIEVRRPTLDDVFLTMTGRSLRDEAAA
ncbi:ATP-binding cassette domain-containing protein [Compostimonas suwonensis]|uniref:ABC-2 type transport system ATP-binding protein n=1 Tax=Compostimonas suwonensis TaxID=1048394 RepID=A0A2M9BCU0_9MICO|nr:ATP-binding cassette domain-containing protein [Compostimonas suwonensis]PJJ55771.1 ABC-2 type transport system ATP-binding protein [Compostimonas suwonensis]